MLESIGSGYITACIALSVAVVAVLWLARSEYRECKRWEDSLHDRRKCKWCGPQ